MKQVTIKNNYTLEAHRHRLVFGGRMPVVIAHCRVSPHDGAEDALIVQMGAIQKMLDRRFGRYGCDIIWIIEKAETGPITPGLSLAVEMLESGIGGHIAVHRHDRVSPTGIELLSAQGLRQEDSSNLKPSERVSSSQAGAITERRRWQ